MSNGATEATSPPTQAVVQKLALGSIAVGVTVLALKYLAYALTGSVALYSDAIESIINVVTAIAAFVAIRVSAKPISASHPYGRSKAEYLSAVLEGALIIVAALAILREAYGAFLNPHPIRAPVLGLLVNGAASGLNAAWCYVLIFNGRRRRSPALVADGTHLLTDVFTSGGVIVGVILVALTGWELLDPIIAALVAINIVWSGWGLLKESFGGLLDASIPSDDLAAVQELIEANRIGSIEAHDLRTRHAGRMTFIDFHLIVDGAMQVEAAHQITDRIEAALQQRFPDSIISIHIEPESKRKWGSMTLDGNSAP